MMGSGKSTVGKILAEVLGYSFFDRFVFSHQASSSSLQKKSKPIMFVVIVDTDGKVFYSSTLQW